MLKIYDCDTETQLLTKLVKITELRELEIKFIFFLKDGKKVPK